MEEEECFDDLSFYEKKMAGRYVVSKWNDPIQFIS